MIALLEDHALFFPVVNCLFYLQIPGRSTWFYCSETENIRVEDNEVHFCFAGFWRADF